MIDTQELLATFQPDFAMGYGSGIIPQKNHSDAKPVLDFIFGVKQPVHWHQLMLEKRPQDYSPIARRKGLAFIKKHQEAGAGIYYHPYASFDNHNIKYGIMSTQRLVEDLLEWRSLYVAGRMHKPTRIITTTPEIDSAQAHNLAHAVNAALLLLPQRCTTEELYTAITALSYTGDSRMKHGEHPHKIRNIVQGNQEQFDQLYSKHLKTRPYIIQLPHIILQDKSPKQNKNHYNALPTHLTTTITTLLQEQKRQAPNYADTEELTQLLNEGLRRIIRPVSIAQTKKGIYSAGLRKSFKYARAKLKKAKQA